MKPDVASARPVSESAIRFRSTFTRADEARVDSGQNASEASRATALERYAAQPTTAERLAGGREFAARTAGSPFHEAPSPRGITSEKFFMDLGISNRAEVRVGSDEFRPSDSSAGSSAKVSGRANNEADAEVVRTTTIRDERRVDTTREDFEDDRLTYTAATAFTTALVSGPGATAIAIGAMWTATTRATSERVITTTTVQNGRTTREVDGDERNFGNDVVTSTTTRTTEYADGTVERSVFDSTDGRQVTTTENAYGATTTTRSNPQLDAANSPRTNITRDEDGIVVARTETSPTGETYGPAGTNGTDEVLARPEPSPSRSTSTRNTHESDGSQGSGASSDFSSSDGDPSADYSSPF